MAQHSVTTEELEQVLADVMELHGYDFFNYSRASLLRRVNRLFLLEKFTSILEMRRALRVDKGYLKRFVEEITVNVTEMFRDPEFYALLRNKVLPELSAKPFIRIWHAGCSTGEEVYSMAILLKECNLLHKSLIYATDINPGVVDMARKGIFPLALMRDFSANYIAAGGINDFSAYYTARYDKVILNEALKEKIIFATHNLVSDSSFNEFQLIMCRNVLIYFDKDLQSRVFSLFDDSLEPLGYLCLGAKETLRFAGINARYRQVEKYRVWRKERQAG
jgi:chemotaxis protein methyltransferase CheR